MSVTTTYRFELQDRYDNYGFSPAGNHAPTTVTMQNGYRAEITDASSGTLFDPANTALQYTGIATPGSDPFDYVFDGPFAVAATGSHDLVVSYYHEYWMAP
jgi:hypothetical protein